MKPRTIVILIFLLLSFISGIYFCATHNVPTTEQFELSGPTAVDCPDLLIKSGNSLLLYNSKLPENPGVNPLPFYNLDEYINYLEIQRKKGIHCPVLFVQEENTTQGESVYRARPDVFDQQGGLPTQVKYNTITPTFPQPTVKLLDASVENPPWNIGTYAGFDPTSQHVGEYTALDAINDSTHKGLALSENPMDSNWGGVLYTKQSVDSGNYKENEVMPPSASGPFQEKSDNIHHEKKASSLSIFA